MSDNEDFPMKDETGTEEDEVEDSSGVEEEEIEGGDENLQKAKQAITCRNVTLNMLMGDGIIEAGKGVLSIDYLGQRFEADLLPSGKIKWHGSEDEFGTPSAWALHCKRLVNPIKRSGCGWASVKYKSKKLDIWKSIWARKHRVSSPFKSPHYSPGQNSSQVSLQLTPAGIPSAAGPVVSLASSCERIVTSTPVKNTASPVKSEEETSVSKVLSLSPVPGATKKPDALSTLLSLSTAIPVGRSSKFPTEGKIEIDVCADTANSTAISGEESLIVILDQDLKTAQSRINSCQPEVSLNSSQSPSENSTMTTSKKSDTSPRPKENHRSTGDVVLKERKYVLYSSLGMRTVDTCHLFVLSDLNTLVRCEHFDSHNKLQPFTVSLTTNAALLLDFHCHLTRSEVVGYLGGRWDPQRQHLSIEQSFPVLCRLGDKFKAPLVEDEIRRRMKTKKITLVGWYHSHPYCMAQPSIRDIDCQMSYQLKMRGSGSTYHPCIGFIEAPYEKSEEKTDSALQGFWVMPNLEHPSSYNIPMHISYTVQRDLSLTEDILIDMRRLTEFYSGAPDRVRFKERWKDTVTYLDKIRTSLACKLPEDQLNSGTFLDYMQQLVKDMK